MRKRKWTRQEVWDYLDHHRRRIYCNPQDGNLFVRKRWGLSWALNWGNPRSWLVTGLFLVVVLGWLWHLGRLPGQKGSSSLPASPPPLPQSQNAPEDLLASMTLRQKVGQLFLVRPDALDQTLDQNTIDDAQAPGITSLSPAMAHFLEEYPVGGVVLFGKNLESPAQLTALNRELQAASEIPLFISVDEEGGSVSRLANHPGFQLPQYESPGAVGASGDPDQALEMGRTIGAYLKEYGFNMDFAPVADVNTNPDNPVIGDRAFSSQAETAAIMAGAMAQGLREEGVLPVFKHFPGHGDTAEDSHAGLAVTYRDAQEMAACEWLPFQEAGPEDLVMVGHIAAPAITGEMTPASLSPVMVNDILKGELGFQGLVITDSLSMGAITENYTPGQAALAALNAGCDLLLMPQGLPDAFDAVLQAVEEGTFPQEELDRRVEKILEVKAAQGILDLAALS